MPRLLWIVVAVSSLSVVGDAIGQESGMDFLQLGPDAESMALGDAQVSRTRNAYATYWNPAGLAAASANSASVSHHLWVADVRTYALATRLGFGSRGAIGLALTASGTSDLEARDGPGDPAGFFGANFLSIGASYGRAVGPIRLGVTAKYLAEEIYEATSGGYAFDFGVQSDFAEESIKVGATLLNVGEMSELGTRATRLPRMVRAGMTVYPLRVLSDEDDADLFNVFAIAELSHVFPDEITRVHLGVGTTVMELIMLRIGYVTNDELRSFTIGGGIEYEAFQVDYAFLPFEEGFGGPGHVMSLAYRW